MSVLTFHFNFAKKGLIQSTCLFNLPVLKLGLKLGLPFGFEANHNIYTRRRRSAHLSPNLEKKNRF